MNYTRDEVETMCSEWVIQVVVAFNAKSILDYRRGKSNAAAAKKNKKEEARQRQRGSENTNRREIVTGARAKTKFQPTSEHLLQDQERRTRDPHETRKKTQRKTK